MSENVMDAIKEMRNEMNQRFDKVEAELSALKQAVREVKKDHDHIGYMQEQILDQGRAIWKIKKELKMTSGE